MFGLPEGLMLLRKVEINFACIHLHGIAIIFPKKRRRVVATIISIDSVSLNFDLTLILSIFIL